MEKDKVIGILVLVGFVILLLKELFAWVMDHVASILLFVAFVAFVAIMYNEWTKDNHPPSPPTAPPNTGADPYDG